MLFGHRLFYYYTHIAGVASDMISLLGELPKEWEPKWTLMKEQSGVTWDNPSDEDETLERKFHDKVHHPSLKKLLPVIRGLMKFRAPDRIEASEAVKLLDSIIQDFEPDDSEMETDDSEMEINDIEMEMDDSKMEMDGSEMEMGDNNNSL